MNVPTSTIKNKTLLYEKNDTMVVFYCIVCLPSIEEELETIVLHLVNQAYDLLKEKKQWFEFIVCFFSGQFAEVYKCHLKNRQISRAVKCIPKGVSEEKKEYYSYDWDDFIEYRIIEKHLFEQLH